MTGLKVIIKDKNNGILSSSIDSMVVRITNIAGELNFYTAAPQGSPRTVAFPLVRSVDGTQMSNATVMLFPSFGKPEFQMSIILKNGNVKSFKQTLNGPLEANSKLTATLTLGDIFSEESSGEFTLDNWNEESQTIDVPSLD
ncbi:FimB/Mfa2 family fimbrial subunit [Bacteroides uniformis]|nr:FimB/Mfa2 family fimbrial subunit [Bacteroides uniformis]